ncbi:phosphohydrolase [Thermodesulfatator atlanticus]|uniref:phosphohydrolase n=1 Tax=Thermodesulfatator atlanticus TaxID=501497 RepID=UPI0003B52C6D|nr:phosphohydrolase [Thermodesulfatator atlanticus]
MKCPGQDTRYWKDDAIFEVKCPNCGESVEFFKDDAARTCPGCGQKLPNPRLDFGCAAYCPYAEQCLGELPSELREKQQAVFKDRIEAEALSTIAEEKRALLKNRLKYAERLALEEGAKLPVVLAAACVFDIQEPENFLKNLNIPEIFVKEILKTLEEDCLESAVLNDAVVLSALVEGIKMSKELKTKAGKILAKAMM